MTVAPGDEVQALTPLTVHTTCDEVTANFPDIGFEDVARIAPGDIADCTRDE